MSTIVTRAGKGSALTHNEVDANFVNLNTDKLQSGNTAAALTITSATINGGTFSGSSITNTSLTSGRVTFASTGGLLADSANLVWDNTNARLGIGTGSPTNKISVYTTDATSKILLSDSTVGSGYGGVLYGYGVAGTGGYMEIGVADGSSAYTKGIRVTQQATTIQFFTGANSAGNAERMRLDSSGNLGIGSTLSNANNKILIRKDGVNTITNALMLNNGTADNQAGTGVSINLSGVSEANANIRYAYIQAATASTGNDHYLAFGTNASAATPTEKMRLDSSGNLGLGVTPSAWNSSYKAIQFGATGALYSTNNAGIANNFYVDSGGVNKYLTTAASSVYLQSSGSHAWYNAPSGTAGTTVSFTQAMTLSAAGNLGIGTTSTGGSATDRQLTVLGTTAQITATNNNTYSTNFGVNATNLSYLQATGATPNLAFYTGASERMRIDSSGNVQIGTSSDSIGRLTIRGTHANNAVLWAGGTDANYTGFSVRPNSASNVTMLSSEWATATVALSFGLGGGEKMRIASSGTLFVGYTSGNSVTSIEAPSISIGQTGTSSTTAKIRFAPAQSGYNVMGIYNSQSVSGGGLVFNTGDSGTNSSNTTLMTLEANGNLLVGTTSNVDGVRGNFLVSAQANAIRAANSVSTGEMYCGFFQFVGRAPNDTASQFITCNDSSATRFVIRGNGGIANYSANNVNLSDRREKTNFALAGDYLDKICAIPVQTFNYNDQNLEEDDGLTLGVVAQDVQAVCPEMVMESNWAGKDEPEKLRLSVYQTDLQYALMKSIQELKAIVDTQAARIATLEGK